MTLRALRASPVAVGITVAVAIVAVVAFFLIGRSADQEERALLQNDTGRAALVASTILGQVGGELDTLAPVVNLTGASPAQFAAEAQGLSGGPLSVALVERTGGRYLVTAAVGGAFRPGDELGGAVATALGRAGATFTPTPVTRTRITSTVGFAVGPPLVPAGTAIYMQLSLDPFTATPVTEGRLFSSLRVALYGSRRPASSNLLVATTRQLPLAGPVARAPVTVGTATWTLVAEARSPLAGAVSSAAPLIILAAGLIVALAAGATTEVLVRRQRYAAQLVRARTLELERSLHELRVTQDALVHSERLSALGEMASVVGHELRNPLTAVVNALFLIRRGLGTSVPEKLEGHLAMAEREIGKATTLAEDLTAFVRPRAPVFASVEMSAVVAEALEATLPPAGVEVSADLGPAEVTADRVQVGEVVTNLLTNAYQAVHKGGVVRVATRAEGSHGVLVIEDTGPGVDEAVRGRLFEPFFTTKAQGTGLGLAIVRRLVESHGGTIAIDNRPSGGARVVVRLPERAPTEVSAPEVPGWTEVPGQAGNAARSVRG